MADRDLLDYTNESELNVNNTPKRRLRMGRLSRLRQKSARKSGNLRVLYTPKESLDLEDNDGILSEPPSKRIRLSSASCTATIGDGSCIDSSFDVVDITPGMSRTQTLPFQSCLNKSTFVSERNLKVIPKPMQQHKTACDLFNNNNMEGLSSTSGSSETHADGQNSVNMVDNNMYGRSDSKSPSVSGITRLQVTKISAMSNKSRIPVLSVDRNSSDITNRMCTKKAETTDYNKLGQLVQISELTWTSHRAEQAASTHKPQHHNEEEDELPATQPVSSLLLKGIVAYVEVRSGGDNRSMGIKSHMRSLGATVRDKFTNDVTHVVFNDGLWSTYKKAVKKKVHLVSVTWIEECKKAQTIVSERLFPPYDMGKYESPCLYKRFRKVRSLQPDFEDMGEQKIKKRRQKKLVHNVNENEPQIELPDVPTYKTPIKVPEFLQTISNENGLVRTLLSVADIGPEYEKIVNRPDSPTLSEEEDFSIPLAVRLLRKILTPQSSSELTSSGIEAEDGINSIHMTDGLNCASGATDAQGTSMIKCVQDPQGGNKDLFCNCVSDGNGRVEVETGNTGTEICNMNAEGNNLSQSLPHSPTHGWSGKILLTRQCKILAKNTLPYNKGKGAKNAKYSISSENIQATTSTADIAETSGAVGNIISENSKYKSSDHGEFSNSNIIEVLKNRPVDNETLATEMCSSQSINKEDQFPNISTSTRVGKGTSVRKRKLFPLLQCDSPEMLNTDVSTVTDETSHLSLQCPYVKERKNAGGKKKKSLQPVGEISVKKFSTCPPSTSSSTTRKCRYGEEGETMNKVPHSSRRSSDEFVRIAKQPMEKKDKPRKMLGRKLPSLVCTGLHKHEVEVVTSVVEKLGGFAIEANVSEKTTHIVTQGPRRTVNLLKGIARGCWIVLQEWVLKSLDADVWLEEDEFELADFSPAIKHCRMQKQSFGPVYNLDLFSTCGYICVSRDCVPPKRDLEELITLCGGRIGPSLRPACILVGNAPSERYKHIKCVNEKWVLDSIQFNTLKPLSEYALL